MCTEDARAGLADSLQDGLRLLVVLADELPVGAKHHLHVLMPQLLGHIPGVGASEHRFAAIACIGQGASRLLAASIAGFFSMCRQGIVVRQIERGKNSIIIQQLMYYQLMQEAFVIRSLSALAHEARLRVFRALVVAGPEGLTPSALAEQLGIAPNALSFHLKELAHASLVSQERQGRNVFYRAAFPAMNDLLAYLTENCCQGAACIAAEVPCNC